MKTHGTFSLVRLLWTALLAVSLPTGVAAFEGKDRDDLILLVQRQEARFADFSAEISTFEWDYKHQLVSSRFRRVVQWQDRLYDCLCRNTPNSNAAPTAFEFTWSDGTKITNYVPPGRLEQYFGARQSPVAFQPYEMLLKTLGFEGTLSEFLQRDGQGLDAWSLQLGEMLPDDSSGFRTLGIRAIRRLPGSSFSSTIDLHLAIDHGYLPCWGIFRENDGNDSFAKTESRVRVFESIKDCGSLMREIHVTSTAAHNDTGSTTVIKFNGHRLTEPPADEVFQPLDFIGNPRISTFQDGELQSVRTYRPIPVKKLEPWPPLTTWLVINDVILGILALIYVARLVVKYAAHDRRNGSVS